MEDERRGELGPSGPRNLSWESDGLRSSKGKFAGPGFEFSFEHHTASGVDDGGEKKRGGVLGALGRLFSRKKSQPALSGPRMNLSLTFGSGEALKGGGKKGDDDHGMEPQHAFQFKFGPEGFSFQSGIENRGKKGGDQELTGRPRSNAIVGDEHRPRDIELQEFPTTRPRSNAISGEEHRPKLGGDGDGEGGGGSRFSMQFGMGKGKSAFKMSFSHPGGGEGGKKGGGPDFGFKIDFAQMAGKGAKGGKGARHAFKMSIGIGHGGGDGAKKGPGGMNFAFDFQAMAAKGGKKGGGHAFQLSMTFGKPGGTGDGKTTGTGGGTPTQRPRSLSAPPKMSSPKGSE